MRKILYVIVAILASIRLAFAAIDINTATELELDRLPGIGPSKAKAIVDDRKKNGPFKSVDELKRVKGIGDKTFDELKGQITVGGGKAVPAAETRPAGSVAKPALAPAAEKPAPAALPSPAGAKPGSAGTKPAAAPAEGKPVSTPASAPAPAGSQAATAASVPAGAKPAAATAAPPAPAGAKPAAGKPAAEVPKPASAVPAPAGAKAAAESAGKKDDKPAEKK